MADAPKHKDFWDKVTVVLHPMGGVLTAVAVTFVGMKGSQVLDRRQSVDTNARLYSELMSRREEAESSLRKDMFVSIISSFLQPSREDPVETHGFEEGPAGSARSDLDGGEVAGLDVRAAKEDARTRRGPR